MAEKTLPPDVKALSFEDALQELDEIVKRLESGQSKLDDSIAAYERGSLLKAHCEAKLREAQMRVDKIAKAADGGVTAAPADLD
ncbi:MAG: exodeoxyribonuclease VII small subunit [Inquilinus sp.]|nr:exodeoxyribonuclease VII small subunit [Inquilinus sp.]